MKLPLHYYGSKILRTKATPIAKITPEIRQLAHDMIETMRFYRGVGLAANQVGHTIALFVASVAPDGSSEDGRNRVYINPKVLWYSDEKRLGDEGCLSIPNCYIPIERPIRVGIEATDLDGNVFQLTLEGLAAANFFHENDHLNGVLHIDRTDAKTRRLIEPKLREIKKKYPPPSSNLP